MTDINLIFVIHSSACLRCDKSRVYSFYIFMITTALAMILWFRLFWHKLCKEISLSATKQRGGRGSVGGEEMNLSFILQPPTHSSKLWFPLKHKNLVCSPNAIVSSSRLWFCFTWNEDKMRERRKQFSLEINQTTLSFNASIPLLLFVT